MQLLKHLNVIKLVLLNYTDPIGFAKRGKTKKKNTSDYFMFRLPTLYLLNEAVVAFREIFLKMINFFRCEF